MGAPRFTLAYARVIRYDVHHSRTRGVGKTALTDLIEEELLAALEGKANPQEVLRRHSGSKGPLYTALARATAKAVARFLALRRQIEELRTKGEAAGRAAEEAEGRAGKAEEPPQLEAGGVKLDREARRIWVGAREVPLSAKEFDLLVALMRVAGRVLDRETLLNTVWGDDYEGTDRTVDVHIRRLRKKMGESASWVETVKQIGYRFREEGKGGP
jgi:DNA-binding response OmpR family regulator